MGGGKSLLFNNLQLTSIYQKRFLQASFFAFKLFVCELCFITSLALLSILKFEIMAQFDFSAVPIHPGEVIKNEIGYNNISQRNLAKEIGMSYSALNELLNAHRPLTTSTALMVEAALGLRADILMRIQLNYNLYQARHNSQLTNQINQVKYIGSAPFHS